MKKVSKVLASMALVSTICMTNTNTIKAAEPTNIIKNDATGIPDPVVYAAALKAGDQEYGNKDGILSVAEAQTISYLNINTPEKVDISLKGVSQLPQLASVNISPVNGWSSSEKKNIINDLEELKQLPLLDTVSMSRVQNIKNFKNIIRENSTLKHIYFYDSDLQTIEGVENAKYLQSLNIDVWSTTESTAELDASMLLTCKNTLQNLSIAGWGIKNAEKIGELHKLTSLNISNTSLPDYRFISKLALEILSVDNTGISDITFLSNQVNLTSLGIGYNKISDITALKGLTKLNSISAWGNAIVDISPLKNCPLQYMGIGSNKIKDISALANKELYYLYLNDNQITDIETLKSVRAKDLDLSNNAISKIDALKGKNFESLGLSTNKISDISALKDVTFESEFTTRLDLSNNQIKDITALQGIKVNALSLGMNAITDLSPLKDSVSLTSLNVSNNKLTTLPDLTKLVNLDARDTSFYGNELTTEELKAKLPKQLSNNVEWIQNNKMYVPDDPIIEIPAVEEIVNATIPADLADKLNAEGSNTVKVTLPSPDTVIADVFKAAKENGKNIQFDVADENGDTQYGWKFNGPDIKNPDMNIDLTIKFETEKQKEIEKLTNQSNMMYVSFAHHGPLPGPATIKVKVDEKYKNGDIVYLYYFNEEKGTIEQNGDGFPVKDGYAEFTIDHCSVYYLSTEKMEEKETKPSPKPVEPTPEPTPDPKPTPVIIPNESEVAPAPKEEEKETKKDKTPNTGDHTNTMVYLVAGAGALAILAALTVRKVKQ